MKKTVMLEPPQVEPPEVVDLSGYAFQKETEKVEHVGGEDTQKNKKRMRRKKLKLQRQAPRPTDKLITELPFANTDIAALFEIPKALDKKEKRKRKPLAENEEGDARKKQKRANYFLSLPITSPKVLAGIQGFQEAVLEKDERLSKAMVPKGSFHLTLFVMQLANEDEVNLAISALLESKRPIEEALKEKTLVCSFRGVGEFKHEIVYGKVIEGDSLLQEIAEIMEKIFKDKGIVIVGGKGFVPHLTFMKLSRSPKLRKQGVKKIDPNLYKDFQDHYFGEEILFRLDLCSMLKKRQPNGYYHTEASVYFDSANNHDPELRSDVSVLPVYGPVLEMLSRFTSENLKQDNGFQCEITTAASRHLCQKNGREPDDAELVSLSKRLVENAVLKAVQQYIEETQGKSRHTDGLSLEPANNEKNEINTATKK